MTVKVANMCQIRFRKVAEAKQPEKKAYLLFESFFSIQFYACEIKD